ncbi:MAG: VOC family protein [Longimicrobiales bacterium]
MGATQGDGREGGGPAGGATPTHIGQIALTVRDIERATEFYRDVVGLPHLFSAPPGLSFFQCGEVRLMLSAAEDPALAPPGSILYYAGADLDAAHRRFVEAGTEVVGEPHVVHRTESMELWIGFYRDPEGNMLGFMEERG